MVSLIFNKVRNTISSHGGSRSNILQIIKGRKPLWWAKYNYVLSAALDSGVAVAAIVIFFALTFPGITFNWWGNTVNAGTVDSKGTPWLELKANETFGPTTWA